MKIYSVLTIFFLFSYSFGIAQTETRSGHISSPNEITERSIKKDTLNDGESLFDIRRNAVYNMDVLLFCYERIIPLKEKFGLTVTGGVLIWDPFNLVGEFGAIAGGPRHFAEMGIGYNLNPFDSDWDMAIFRLGYRYQSKKGLMVKASAAYVNEPLGSFVPLVGIGYAF